MEGLPDPNYKQEIFQKIIKADKNILICNKPQPNLQPNFKVNWLLKCEYPFQALDGIPGNQMNEDEPILMGFNGSEIPFKLGNYLCHLLLKEGMDKFSKD